MEVKIQKKKKKNTQTQNLKKKNMKNKSNYKREIHVKYTLRLDNKGFVETKEQKWQRNAKLHKGFWYGSIYIVVSRFNLKLSTLLSS